MTSGSKGQFVPVSAISLLLPVAQYMGFIANTKAELRSLLQAYHEDRFGQIPGSEKRQQITQAALNLRAKNGTD